LSATLRTDAPALAVGDRVITAILPHDGHHRIPRYARGREGTVVHVHPRFHVADDIVAGIPHDPETVYTVEFAATVLWGGRATGSVCIDVWERFLTRVSEQTGGAR
jgi:nitrile hydratase